MPKMNGLECLKKLKLLDREKRAKIVNNYFTTFIVNNYFTTFIVNNYFTTFIVMVTGSAEKEIVIEVLKSGASGYIVKPLTQEAIKKYL